MKKRGGKTLSKAKLKKHAVKVYISKPAKKTLPVQSKPKITKEMPIQRTVIEIKTAEPPLAKDLTIPVPTEYNFWLSDGRIIKSAKELAEACKDMSEEVFASHANNDKNDFADWVRDIIKDQDLAYSVRKALDKNELYRAIKQRLKEPMEDITPKEVKPVPQAHQEHTHEHKLEAGEFNGLPAKIEKEMPSKDTKLDTLSRKEEQLRKAEHELNLHEEKLNQEKLNLTRKRYELLKERGEIEKQKFEFFINKRISTVSEVKIPDLPQIHMPRMSIDKEKIESSIQEARKELGEGKIEEATKRFMEIEHGYEACPIKPQEKKMLKLKIMELEADVKLANLKF